MASTEHILLQLVRAALWQREPETDGLPLDEAEWSELHFMAHKQTVQGIVYDALCQLPEHLLPPADLLIQWMREVQALEATHQQHIRALAWTTTRIEAESALRPIVLKGLPLATLYPTPAHRVSGDIDLYYGSAAAATEADSLVESWGQCVNRGEQGESLYMVSDVPIEHHAHLMLSHVPWRRQRLNALTERTLALGGATRELMVGEMPVRVLSPELDMVQLSAHNLKHSLNEGIGLRQLSDLALFVSHNREALRQAPLRQLLGRYGLRRWTDLCLAYCATHLGLSAHHLPYPIKASRHMVEAMHREVMQSGNFGKMDHRYARSPEGNAKATAHRVTLNVWRYFRLSPLESLCWYTGLIARRAKESITGKPEKPE